MKTKKIFFILLLSVMVVSAQQSENNFIASLKSGFTFAGLTSYMFLNSSRFGYHPILPNFSLGIGAGYSNVARIKNIYLNADVEFSFGESSTGSVNIGTENAEFIITSIPILFWCTLKTSGEIVPFLKFGIGVENLEFKERHSIRTDYNYEIKDWFFAWGLGAGIDFRLTENFLTLIYVETFIKEKSFSPSLRSRMGVFDNRYSSTFGGIQLGYKIF